MLQRVVFPWYDSQWLGSYKSVEKFLKLYYPEKLPEFQNAMTVLKTPVNFKARLIPDFFDQDTIQELKLAIDNYNQNDIETHELDTFDRHVIHDHPLFLKLQNNIKTRVEEMVGEKLDVSYNFASMYHSNAECPVHMDAPDAKWTLDICIDQSEPWDINFSNVVDWPENWEMPHDGDWKDSIKSSVEFDTKQMVPGQAILFSGSSQWHYRDKIPGKYCTLLFFHFIPQGTQELADPFKWSEVFGIPELNSIVYE